MHFDTFQDLPLVHAVCQESLPEALLSSQLNQIHSSKVVQAHPTNLSFGLSSSDLEEFAPSDLAFSAAGKVQETLSRAAERQNARDASKVPKAEGVKPETQVTNTQTADAHHTNQPHIALPIRHADCQATIIYDPINHALATVHCGWKGSVANIYENTLHELKKHYGTRPENALIGISPSLGPSAAEFIHYRTELPKHFWPFQPKPTYFDFWEISRWQLKEAGVLDHHIEIAGLCTYSDPERFHSYRRDRTCMRHITWAFLK